MASLRNPYANVRGIGSIYYRALWLYNSCVYVISFIYYRTRCLCNSCAYVIFFFYNWRLWPFKLCTYVKSFVYNWTLDLRAYATSFIDNCTAWFSDTENGTKRGEFKVYIYKEEFAKIRKWVLQKHHTETGGDLFGLWLDQHNVVVQFVLGPGKNCRRSETSFFQDIDYLASVGTYITRNHGLCNIGQWHSHHRLNLPKPSFGDENTVWNNMPNLRMTRYVVFIATIKDSRTGIPKTDVNCFLFEIENERKLPVLKGEICVIGEKGSPLRMCNELTTLSKSGLEQEDYVSVQL